MEKVRNLTNIFISFSLNQRLPRNSSLTLRIRGGRNNKNDWYYLQPYDPNLNGFIKTNLANYTPVLPILITGKDLLIKYLIIGERGIDANQIFAFDIYETLVQSIVEDNKNIEIIIETPNNNPAIFHQNATINILHQEKDHFTVICPSTVNIKENIDVLVRVEDKFYNLVKDFLGKIEVFELEDQKKPRSIGIYEFDKDNEGILKINNHKFETPGIKYLEIEHNASRFRSNPIMCRTDSTHKRLYWGYIHGHTNKSDGVRDPKDYYTNLLNAGLDFGTSTEHDHIWETKDEDFNEIRHIVDEFLQVGHFVTFFGYEWGYWYTPGYGDICIYHRDDSIPILRSDTNKYNSTKKLIKNLQSYKPKVLMIGHHTALRPGYRDWSHFDNTLEKLTEIYSTWGNQEYSYRAGNPLPPRYKFFGYGKYAKKRGPVLEKKGSFVQDALLRGHKLGFTAGGDDHFGIYPSGALDPDNGIYPSGIMAVWAEELTRESLWNSLTNRHCYGTTGPRAVIEFSIDDYFMGDIINLKDNLKLVNERIIKFKVISPVDLQKIELIRNNSVFKEKIINSEKIEISYQDNENFGEVALSHIDTNEKFVFYYIRIFLKNNNMAWSSPIWIISD